MNSSTPSQTPSAANAPRHPFHIRIPGPGPAWQANLVVFGCLIGIVLALVYWQIRSTEHAFRLHVRAHARLLGSVIQQHAATAVLSETAMEAIMRTFLGNTARFADYLDTIAPFSSEELEAFTSENGLAGIRITGRQGRSVQGPEGWLPQADAPCGGAAGNLTFSSDRALYILNLPRPSGGCIHVGFQSKRIQSLRRRLGLDTLLDTLSGMAEIEYARHVDTPETEDIGDPPAIAFRVQDGKKIAQARMPMAHGELRLGINAGLYFQRVRQLWTQFFITGGILALTGLVFSWLLYRYQAAYIKHLRAMDRRLAKEKEDAALGRATGAIAHELRNPLNAISMGLQRLKTEAGGLSAEQAELIDSLLSSVRRSNGLISDLKQFAGPIRPACRKIHLRELLSAQLTLYDEALLEQGVVPDFKAFYEGPIEGDSDLLAIVFENLVRNALEAQPDGGYLKIRISRQSDTVLVLMENTGLDPESGPLHELKDPYMTTKTRGSGLGLAIADRIARAHGGSLELTSPEKGMMQIRLSLPLSGPDSA